ncbi:MAG: MBL fold metallo-hydrolase, partial [Clostridia bacterium]|nr:MBL fold metallo-hydrolase [Clostridia bacterium]
MKITWLGQAGLMFETENKIILVDPYLSDNVKNFEPKNYRRVPVDERFLKINPDVIIITHNHLDHLDKETLKYYLTEDAHCLVLAPNGSWQELRKFGGNSNYVLFNNGTTWTEGKLTFTAVKAEHSDPYAIGVIINAEGKNYYVTGDTLYNEQVFESLPDIEIEAVFLPVNGVGNNMNMKDAARFARRVNAKYTVPVHFGMF